MKYVCNECGYKTSKWVGRCLECGSWDSLSQMVEEKVKSSKSSVKIVPKEIGRGNQDRGRYLSGVNEWDRVLGGGLTQGSVTLLTGSPGVGKSTLLLQAMNRYAINSRVLYISGEESESQISSRANRVIGSSKIKIASSNDIDAILNASIDYDIIAIDSIQTMVVKELGSLPGTISQIRESISKIISCAKSRDISFIVVGHVNKDGKVAGPKLLEHMVDTLLELEGDRDFQYRILRSTKNRFGSLNEIGVFTMLHDGIQEVDNPSEFFISERRDRAVGSVISPIVEGNRVFLMEIQALSSTAIFGLPRRVSQGIESSKVQILTAIAEKHLSLNLSNQDIFFNIPGGVQVKDISVGLAVILALISSIKSISISAAAIGEVGLTGEVRKVSFIQKRVNELERLGFKEIFTPVLSREIKTEAKLIELSNIKELIDYFDLYSK